MSNEYLNCLTTISEEDVSHLKLKEKTYGDSWKKRGGTGAFMIFARKMDRLEIMLPDFKYDIFEAITAAPKGEDSTVLAEVRDLRRYLLLVEAEMVARGVVAVQGYTAPQEELFRAGTPDDGGHHARHTEE